MRRSVGLLAGLLAAAASASALELGGTTVPKDRIVVYLFIGHSNMAGRSSQIDTTTHERAWSYQIPDNSSRPEGWRPAQAPVHRDSSTNDRGGPAMPFLKAMVARFPEYHVGVIQNANTQASVRWVNGEGSGNRYRKGMSLYGEIISRAGSLKSDVTIGGIIAMLGYMDSNDGPCAATFADDVAQMVAEVRADLGMPDLPFLIGRYEVGADSKPPYWQTVRDEIEKIPGIVSRSAIIDPDLDAGQGNGDYEDDHHYSYQGHCKWSQRAADLIAANGWFPQAAPPHQGPGALLVVGEVSLGGGDAAAKARLEALGYEVLVVEDGAAKSADAAGTDLVVISSSCGSGSVAGTFRDVAVPAVVWENYAWDDMGMTGPSAGSDFGCTGPDQDAVSVIGAGHPLAGGLSGTVVVQTSDALVRWGKPGLGAVEVATVVGDSSLVSIFGYEKGASMVGMAAPARRVGFFADDEAPSRFTADGWVLFDAAVGWAAGTAGTSDTDPPGAPTGLSASATGPTSIELEWQTGSEPDLAGYRIYRSTQPGVSPSASNRVAAGVTFPPYTDYTASPLTTYHYVVTAVDVAGNESLPSGAASAATPAERAVELLAPNGGEVWYAGTTRCISWSAAAVRDVKILYATQEGGPWHTIETSLDDRDPEWLCRRWVVPNQPSVWCRVLVSDYNETVTDVSAAPFEIRAVGDADADGMDDGWEVDQFSSTSLDGTGDADGDGLADREEFVNGTDPNAADTDGDGMPDAWEIEHRLDPAVDTAAADVDGDGFADADEHVAGSDPRDPASTPDTIGGDDGSGLACAPGTGAAPNALAALLALLVCLARPRNGYGAGRSSLFAPARLARASSSFPSSSA